MDALSQRIDSLQAQLAAQAHAQGAAGEPAAGAYEATVSAAEERVAELEGRLQVGGLGLRFDNKDHCRFVSTIYSTIYSLKCIHDGFIFL